jgi:hypothetical protein
MEKPITKFFTFKSLKDANEKAKSLNLNRTLSKKFFKELDRSKVYPISFTMTHNDDQVRVRFVHDDHGTELSAAWIDMTFEDFFALPSA